MYIVLYNTKYRRQFEAVVSKDSWDQTNLDYGAAEAAFLLIAASLEKKKGRKVTTKRAKSAVAFVMGPSVRPDIYGAVRVKVANTKKEMLDRGLGEYRIYSTRKSGVQSFRIRKRDKSARKRRLELYGYPP